MPHILDEIKQKIEAHKHHDPKPAVHQRDLAGGSDKDTAINIHNTARNPKGCPNVTWDDNLASDAAKYAQQLADEDKMHHSGVQGQGENLYWSSDDGSFADAVNMWVKEGEKYHGEKIGEGNLADWGHYTQVMWKQSVQIGMGKAKSKAGGTYIVARYTPQGNMYGQTPY